MKIYTLNDILKTEHLGHERYIRIEEIERLKKVLEKYGGHSRACAVRTPQTYPTICNCGYEQALKEEIDDNSRNSNKKTN